MSTLPFLSDTSSFVSQTEHQARTQLPQYSRIRDKAEDTKVSENTNSALDHDQQGRPGWTMAPAEKPGEIQQFLVYSLLGLGMKKQMLLILLHLSILVLS